MKNITLLITAFLAGHLFANAQISCTDLNGYPQSKDIGPSSTYTLTKGIVEKAAQTYHYSVLGKIIRFRIYGSTPNSWVNLVAKVYNVDVNGRPTTVIGSQTFTWTVWDNLSNYKDVVMPGSGISVNANFACSVEIASGTNNVSKFRLRYTGDGDGKGEDLASLSSGSNWASAKDNFSKDGDFYILPFMRNYVTPEFTVNTNCLDAGGTVNFTNTTVMTLDSMFNKIGLSNYSGTAYYYTWNFGDGSSVSHAKNPTHVFALGSVHTVTLTAAVDGWNGICSSTFTKQISVGLTASLASTASVTCNGGADGNIVALASGGASPYLYSLNGLSYQSGTTFSGLAAGAYSVYVKDLLGCIKTTTVSITQPGSINFSPSSTTNASCGNPDGALLVSAATAVQYSINGSTWQTSGSFTNLSAGGYTVWAKDAKGCTSSTNVVVNDLGGPSLTLNSITHAACNGSNTGSILVTGSGGSGTLQYSLDGINYQSSGAFNNLPAGTYNVRVKDGLACIDLKTVIISEPPILTLTASSTIPVSCNGGSDGQIKITSAIGGTGTFAYSVNGINYQSSTVFNGLAAGTYSVTVRDAAGCMAKTTVAVSEPAVITAIQSLTNLSCNGSQDGEIRIIASGGTPGYSYSMDGINFFPTGDFSGLAAGSYTITVKDENGCVATTTAILLQPAGLTATVTTGNSTCGNANGNILVSISGGSGSGYQYSIDGSTWNTTGSFTGLKDSSYIIIGKDGSGCSISIQTYVTASNGPVIQTVSTTNVSCFDGGDGSITVTSVTGGTGTLQYSLDGSAYQLSNSFPFIPAGNHTIIVKDALGCSGSYTIAITQPTPVIVTTSVTNVRCNGDKSGSVLISAGGGSGTLAYSLDGNYMQSSNLFNNLFAGSYTAYVRDAGGCFGYSQFVITEPLPILIKGIGVLNVSCKGAANGSLFITATGGTGTLTYSIDGTTYQPSNSFSGLSGGPYTVYVKDANGCIETFAVTINEPAAISVTSNIYNVTCSGGNNGVIDITVSGGSSSYSYSWSNASSNEDAFNLTAGTYTVVVTDGNGCTAVKSFTVTQPSNPLIVNGTVTDATGSSSGDGAINTTVTGGTAPYTYSWSNGATTKDVSGLNPGAYIVTIKDVNGCITSGVFNVTVVTGIQTLNKDGDIQIYPNPANEFVTVLSNGSKISRVDIYNIMGEIVYREEPKSEKTQIDLSSQSTGLYFLKININGNLFTRKVQINR